MSTLDILNTVFAGIIAIGVAIAAWSLHESRRTRDVNSLLVALFRWSSDEVCQARQLCEDYGFGCTYREAMAGMKYDELPDHYKYKIITPLNILESIAVLEKRGGTSFKSVVESFGNVYTRYWEKMGPFIKSRRAELNNDKIFASFERLATKIEQKVK